MQNVQPVEIGNPVSLTNAAKQTNDTEIELLQRVFEIIELKKHNIHEDDIAVFLEEVGNLDTYDAQAVLGWLGY